MDREEPDIRYLPANSVDAALDRELRALLSTCFTGPQDFVFKHQRYFHEPYNHRWVTRNEQGAIVAHIGVHDKTVEADGQVYRIGGIGDVCVHPDYRGKGYVGLMLAPICEWLAQHGFVFSVLFGNPRVYGSSGYVAVDNVFADSEGEGRKQIPAMAVALTDIPWPVSDVYLPGILF